MAREDNEMVTIPEIDLREEAIDAAEMEREDPVKETQLIQFPKELDQAEETETQPEVVIAAIELREVVINQLTKETEEATIHRELNVAEILDLRETRTTNHE